MTNQVRTEVRRMIDELKQLRDVCENTFEVDSFNVAMIALCKADYHDFHLHPRKRFIPSKKPFPFHGK